MGDVSAEPSMEDILSSIKRIIAEDVEAGGTLTKRRRAAPPPPVLDDEDDVLELSEMVPEAEPVAEVEPQPEPAPQAAPMPMSAPKSAEAEAPEPIVSAQTAEASRAPLASLSRLVVKPEVTGSDTLEGLVREMLKPMLRDWLDANLPGMVEAMVAKEIARITGQG